MRRRAKSEENGSLDLLLDTLCNTFGGILLISLLVIILLNVTTEETAATLPSEVSKVELLEKAIKQQDLKIEIERLKTAVDSAKVNSEGLLSKDIAKLANAVKLLRRNKDRLTEQKTGGVAALAETQKQINDTAQKNKDLATALETAEKKLASIRKEIESEVEKRSRTAQIPKVERSAKTGEIFFLAGGKLYGPAISTSEIVVQDIDSIGYRFTPNTSMGTRLTGAKSDQDRIERKLRSINASTSDIRLFIWDDSFEHYETVRNAMEKLSLKCTLGPETGPHELFFGQGGGGGRYSQ